MKTKLFFLITLIFLFPVSLASSEELSLQPPAATQAPAAANPAQTNKITLDIKGMDIIDALKMLAVRSGMDMVVGKNVSGRVTLFLKDVDIWDVFEIMLAANDLAYDKQGEIINVMTQKDYELKYGERHQDKKQVEIVPLKYARAQDLSRALTQIKTNLGKVVADENTNTLAIIDTPEKIKEIKDFIKNADVPIQTRVFNLSYAQADKLQPKIQEILTKNVGYVKIDERTNKIVVSDYAQKLDDVANIVNAFDEKPQQVLIDAQIIQMQPSDLFEMGIDWNYWIEKYFDIKASLPVGTANRLIFGTSNSDPTKAGQYKAMVDILRTLGDTKVLASPRITVLNNQEAKIHVGERDAYITSTTSQSGSGTSVTSQSVNFIDVGTQLYVTPTINRDGFITMKLKPEISTATLTDIKSEGQITQIPIVTTSEAETTLMVKDGVTIIIGGLKKESLVKTVKKIPLLGDIPVLGLLFKSTSSNKTLSELVILITPHIMTGEKAYVDFAEVKPKDGAVAKMVGEKIITEKVSFNADTKNSSLVEITLKNTEAELQFKRQYYNLVTDRISALASSRNRSTGKHGRVEVFFTLNAKGQLKDLPRVVMTNNYELNDAAIKSVEIASPFPPFPKEIEKAEEDFRIAFEYK